MMHADKVLCDKNAADAEVFKTWVLDSIRDIVDLFISKADKLYDEKCADIMAKNPIFKNKYIANILNDTAGYTGTELIRRIVGMAKVKDITTIEDDDKRVSAERKLLLFAKKLMLENDRFTDGKSYVDGWLAIND